MAEEKATADKLGLFISYSRHDSAIADALVAALTARGFSVSIDRRSLEFGEKWQAQLSELIRLSDTVIWLVSEPSIRSQWVNWELDEVARRNKRLVPVMVGDARRDQLPRQIGEVHILPAEGSFDLAHDLDVLVRVLETDRRWLKEASRLADRAHEWLSGNRTGALLLRGAALKGAESWKDRRPVKAPAPAQEVLELILASRRAATQRQRWWIGGSLAVTVSALALAAFAGYQWQRADRQRDLADAKSEEATRNLRDALANQSRLLARLSGQLLQSGDAGTALALALESLPTPERPDERPLLPEAVEALRVAATSLREIAVLQTAGTPFSAALAPSADLIIAGSWIEQDADTKARIFDARTGRLVGALEGHSAPVAFVGFNTNGRLVWTISNDRTLRIWDVEQKREIARLETDEIGPPSSEQRYISTAAFSGSDYGKLLFGTSDGVVGVWTYTRKTDDSVRIIGKHAAGVDKVLDSTFGRMTASLSDNGGLLIYQGKELRPTTPTELRAVDNPDASLGDIEVVFSHNGDKLMTRPFGTFHNKRTARIWQTLDGELLKEAGVEEPKFAPDEDGDLALAAGGFMGGEPIVAIKMDRGRMRFTDGGKPPPHGTHAIQTGLFPPDLVDKEDEMFIGTAASGAILIWRPSTDTTKDWTSPAEVLDGHDKAIINMTLRANVDRLMTVSNDGTIRVWSTAQPRTDEEKDSSSRVLKEQSFAEVFGIINATRAASPRCLTPSQRAQYLLPDAPPPWCVERQLWPYHGDDWQSWLAARKDGRPATLPGPAKR